ncbi:ubiquitin carboxyl-terminal hydrolase [Anaeramoeba flamelloides]|uniref:Ubiquitin carboxyl-terminal hydrolase n=1 Tax=Anaeramoeba flamelloides TaxID=1746091 RepID=A0ABQ8XDK4_9EUKA|nr:ubiquitin carboxyl-terminal hydrolase [Anaeramoeba flamelloides]
MKNETNNNNKIQNEKKYDLLKYINEFVSPEQLSGSNSVICENCTQLQNETIDGNNFIKTETVKKIVIERLPKILVFNLKRFTQDFSGHYFKNNRFVSFPEEFSMNEFIDFDESQKRDWGYKLIAITMHSGNINSGHYSSISLKSDGNWYSISDKKVNLVEKQNILKTSGYILFYRLIEK